MTNEQKEKILTIIRCAAIDIMATALPPDLYHPKYGWLWRNGKPNLEACRQFDEDLKREIDSAVDKTSE
jgi:hypothetical protein